MAEAILSPEPEEKPAFNPWVFIPLLYFMQSIPVTIVQELSVIIYKDLGIDNAEITRWTSLIALPWGLQMLLGPLVDLNGTKRRWILGGQLFIAIGLAAAAFAIRLPNAFTFTLVVFGLTAIFSALTNIATDGFALLSMTKKQQAAMAGFMSTFYRLGRLFCAALLVMFAGIIARLEPLDWTGALVSVKSAGQVKQVESGGLVIQEGLLAVKDHGPVEPEIKAPPGVFGLELKTDGEVLATMLKGTEPIGRLPLEAGSTIAPGNPVKGPDPKTTWFIVLSIAVGVYAVGRIVNAFTVPKPPKDTLGVTEPGETAKNIYRTVSLLGLGVGGYFLLNATWRLVAHGIWAVADGQVPAPDTKDFDKFQGWMLKTDNKIPFLGDLSFGGVGTEVFQFAVCATVVFAALTAWRKLIAGSEMGEALTAYIRQPGFHAIFLFILFYRFPEAMVGKITPLFLKDSLDNGGLAIANAELGVLNGFLGVVGIILGGICGGLTVSKLGLRKSFIPLMLAMNGPNLLYLALFYKWLPMVRMDTPMFEQLNMTVGGVLFVDQFGYGFGFAGYMVYLMWVAQRGRFITSHYAIGTGMGAITIALSGVISGVVYQTFKESMGYGAVFISVLVLSIPGLLSLLLIPLDDSHKQIKAELAD